MPLRRDLRLGRWRVDRGDRKTKVTYSLPVDLVDEVRSVVRDAGAVSYSMFVERALRQAVRGERERLLELEFAEAARDPQFMADLEETEQAFRYADEDALGSTE